MRFVEAGVQLPVEFGPASDVVFADEVGADRLGAGEGGLVHVRHRQADRLRLEQHPHFEHLRQFRFGNTRHHRALVALEQHQAFRFQALEGLADGNLADIEELRDVVLADRFVLGEMPGDDRFAQVLGDDLGGRRAMPRLGALSMERGKRGNLRGVGNVRDIVYERSAAAAAGWRLLRRRVGRLQWASVAHVSQGETLFRKVRGEAGQ